jgi:tRNA 2-thiouridine synthesizing protein A
LPANIVKINEQSYALDVRGYTCPYPEFYTAKALEQLGTGHTLEVILDNPPSCETIPTVAKKRKSGVLEVTKINDTTWKIIIKKQ